MRRRVSLGRSCIICDSPELLYEFATASGAFFECRECGLLMCDPTESHARGANGRLWIHNMRDTALSDEEKVHYLEELLRHAPGGRLLQINCGDGTFLKTAHTRGYMVAGYEETPELAAQARALLGEDVVCSNGPITEAFEPESFDVVVLFDMLGRFADPIETLRMLRRMLVPNGVLLLSTPVLDSPPARLFRQSWAEFYKDVLFFFTTQNIQNALFKAGFDRTLVVRHRRLTDVDWLSAYLTQFRVPRWLAFLTLLLRSLPAAARRRKFYATGGHAVVISRASEISLSRPRLSVIVPVFNERATFRMLMDKLLAKQVPGLDKEIIIVESNSRDGTREEVLSYCDHPDVRIVLQDRPRGKGNAVRAGLAAATGHFVIIQDADLEYDLNDYDALLEPLVKCRHAFVIGSRHTGSDWKMREFDDAPIAATFFNLGHVVFRTLLNVMYAQRLKDPFSMFKVFRRECLYGLTLECNRFDFDFELVIKLIRKGYQPIEIPVNYRARSFSEGKKVSAWRDPITWIRALVKYRIEPLTITIQPHTATAEKSVTIRKVGQI